MTVDLEKALDVARRAVARAQEIALRAFHTAMDVEMKANQTPVTAADKGAERAILETLGEAFPDIGVLAEESGARAGKDPSRRWIVDPLDGTRGFIRGGPFWGPMVALEEDGEVVLGVVALPVLGETYHAARGLGCYCNDVRVRVSTVDDLAKATLSVGEIGALLRGPAGQGVRRLIDVASSTRGYGDLAGALQVVAGRADVWLEADVAVWDLAPHKILVEEAGGRFTDIAGVPSIASGNALATNGRLHEAVRGILGA